MTQTSLARAFMLAAALLAVCACATDASKKVSRSAKAQDDLTAAVGTPDAQIQRYRIRDWSAPNDHTVILMADNGERYRAETLGTCIGLNFANQIAFVNRGSFQQIDKYSSIVLTDGTRCAFQSFDKLKAPESKALDSYEKAGEKPAPE